MAHVYLLPLEVLSTFGAYIDRYCRLIFKLPGCRIEIVMDRYDAPSIKDQKQTVRVDQVNEGHKRTLMTKTVPIAISRDVGLP